MSTESLLLLNNSFSMNMTENGTFFKENVTFPTNLTENLKSTSPPDISVADTMAKIYISIGTFGMTGNLLVIGIILTSVNMRKKLTNKYIVNQSSTDFLCSLFLLLGFATVKDNVVPYKGLKGDLYCLVCFKNILLL